MMGTMNADLEKDTDTMSNIEPMGHNDNIESYSDYNVLGGKKRRKGPPKKRGTRSTKKRVVKGKGTKKKGTRKTGTRKKGPSKWIMHVKAFCKKTGKNFPQALKDPLCKKTFKH